MNYKAEACNNFCRVFELPDEYPKGFCFDGGIPLTITMIDWFNPISNDDQLGDSKVVQISHKDLYADLIPYIKIKPYIKPKTKYLVLCDFGASLLFTG